MKADAEQEELKRKLAGTALGYEEVAVSCLIATHVAGVRDAGGMQVGLNT